MKQRSVRTFALLALTAGWVSRLFGQVDVWPSVWDGVYTASQAARGEAIYRTHCASCHGTALQGAGLVPPLTGRDFRWDWDLTGVDNLYEKMMFTMPLNRQGQLTPVQEADILAYILKFNGFPAGNQELPADGEKLRVVLFEADKATR
jgi:S-disulfanyl-L-cysteine oxidoreductase SoxD